MRDQSEAGTSISAHGANFNGSQPPIGKMGTQTLGSGHIINVSPMKQSLSKYCNEKSGPSAGKAAAYQGTTQGGGSSIQNVHQRLREYQGSHGKTSVSKALFQGQKDGLSDKIIGSPSKI